MVIDNDLFRIVFNNHILINKIFKSIRDIHLYLYTSSSSSSSSSISLSSAPCNFYSLSSKSVSYLKIDLPPFITNNCNNNYNSNNNNDKERNIKLLYLKLKEEEEEDDNNRFILHFRALPQILRCCKDVQVIEEIAKRYPHYIHNTLCLSTHEYFGRIDKTYQSLEDSFKSTSWIADNVAASGSLECLNYVINILGIQPTTATSLMACEYGHENIVDYLRTTHSIKLMDRAFEIASFHSHLSIIQYLLKYYPTLKYTSYALLNNLNSKVGKLKDRIEIAKLLIDNIDKRLVNGLSLSVNKYVDLAVKSNSIELIQIYFNKFGKKAMSPVACEWVRSKEVLVYLVETLKSSTTPYTMTYAAGEGLLDVVSYLNENSLEDCSESALSTACSAGHLEVVKYLIESRKWPRLDGMAFHNACVHGYFDIVIYLHNHTQFDRLPGTIELVIKSAKREYQSISKYLLENDLTPYKKKDGKTTGQHYQVLFVAACFIGDKLLFQWLINYFGFTSLIDVFPVAADKTNIDLLYYYDIGRCIFQLNKSSNSDMMIWFLKHYEKYFDPLALLRKLNGVPSVDILEYLYQLDPNIFQGRLDEFTRLMIQSTPMNTLMSNQVVQFFHQRKCGEVSLQIINYLIAMGHLQTLKYIYDNTNERAAIPGSFAYALEYRQLEVAQFLYNHHKDELVFEADFSKCCVTFYEGLQFLIRIFSNSKAEIFKQAIRWKERIQSDQCEYIHEFILDGLKQYCPNQDESNNESGDHILFKKLFKKKNNKR